MGLTIIEKIIKEHLVCGEMKRGSEIGLKIDQTLTQDATGTMAYLEFEAMGLDRVKTELSLSYVDHNTLQSGYMNADDHTFLRTVAEKYGVLFSRPGNGICHQVHMERFGIPGKTLIGSDSHTPTAGGLGMLAIGAGGLDVAVAMGGGAYYITMPRIIKVNLTGKLRPFVSAKDVSLELLRQLGVKGGVGFAVEWGGTGVLELSVPERATITNMGAEIGATTSVFPSDSVTEAFLKAQSRAEAYRPLAADEDAVYDRVIDIDLSQLEPLCACPHMPDKVKKVSELSGQKIDQVCIGSCTNSSLYDMLKVAAILKGKTVAPSVSLSVSCGSRQVLGMLADCGALSDILASGARLLECACGPCIGMGFSPNSGGVSLRTFNRNFEGRSGTKDAGVYLVSPETAAVSAIAGCLTDPSGFGKPLSVKLPAAFKVDDSSVLLPASPEKAADVKVIKGPNIKDCPVGKPLCGSIETSVVLKVGDDITTDHIMPAGSRVLPYRSNIEKMAEFCFEAVDPDFPKRAKAAGNGIIIGGENYGQGSSREHAALAPLKLGIRAVIAKSFARIHAANLINAGIIPLEFENPGDYDLLSLGMKAELSDVPAGLDSGIIIMKTQSGEIRLKAHFSERSRAILKAGGLLLYTAKGGK